MKFSTKTAFWAASLLLVISLSNSVYSANLLPKRLHCSSTVFLHKTVVEEGPLITYEQSRFEEYQVDEYLDLSSNRSSVAVFDVNTNEHEIYYNEVSADEYAPERQLVVYNPIERSCRGIKIYQWLLAEMRWIMITLASTRLELDRARFDVAIGPSGMLYSLEDSLETYLYTNTFFSLSRLTLVDVYRRTLLYTTARSSKTVTVVVHVMSRGKSNLRPGDPLSKLQDKAQANDKDPFASINIALVGVCEMGSEPDDPAIERAAPIEDGKDLKADLQLAEKDFCRRDKTLFVVHYNIVAGFSHGSLLGTSLDELGESRYDFHREPFMMPTGIGCRSDDEALDRWQKRLTRDNPMNQLSAEYVSEYGPRGVSFIAYDRQRDLARVDRNGRKSVYDLLERTSYHVGEFKESHEVLSSGLSQKDKSQYNELLERCVALDSATMSQIVPSRNVVQQLLGLRPNSADEQYLGSRIIDHVNYEVFERELRSQDGGLPLVLQFAKYRTHEQQQDTRLFLTYYAQSIVELANREQHPILSYVEIWKFNTVSKSRSLLNRVHFTQFSWQLDVEPTNDAKNQHSDNLSLRLFDFEQCHQERAAQAEILVECKRNDSVALNGQLIGDLYRNRHAIAEIMQSIIAGTLEISHLNLVDFKLRPLDNGNLLASSRVVDLQSGLSDNQRLGYGFFFESDIFDKNIQRVFSNRHSREECLLESISWSKPNWVAVCDKLALCVILEQKDELKQQLQQKAPNSEDMIKDDFCFVYAFRHANANPIRSATYQADRRGFYLARKTLMFDLEEGREVRGGESKPQAYVAALKLREFKELDAIGARLTNEAALLDGLRYSTPREMPIARNLNTRVFVPRDSRLGAFRFCQLACQMDDLCGSFSVCKRNGKANKYGEIDDDCVLSSIRLDGERVNQLATNSKESRNEIKFSIRVTGEYYSQVLVMYHDDTCSLHPKDFVADYEKVKTLVQHVEADQYVKKDEPAKKAPVEKLRVSLDDCAGLSYERNAHTAPNQANFTYCPLNSQCILLGDDQKSQMEQMDNYCYVFRRHLTRPYQVRHMMHMVLTRRGEPAAGGGGGDIVAQQKGFKKELNPIAEAARMEEQKLVKKLWSLDTESCAQECNLRRTHCLAFDSCRQAGKVLCVLFAIRSPLAKTSAYLPQLALERKTASDHDVTLLNNLICDHYYLKPDYLEVRLKHFLALEGAAGSSNLDPTMGLIAENAERDGRVKELEQKIADKDEQRSQEEAKQLELEVGGKPAEGGAKTADASHANKWFHLGALLVGLLLGAVGTTYRHQIGQALATGYNWYQIRRAHNDDRMGNRLVLDDPLSH